MDARRAGLDRLRTAADASPVLRERALVESVPLHESTPGAWINAATTAVLERMDTAWLRRLDRDRMAAG